MRAAPAALAVIAGLLVGHDAEARPKKKKTKVSDVVDVSAAKAQFVVLTDDEGDVYVLDSSWRDDHLAFYGEGGGKDVYQLRIFGGGADSSTGQFSFTFWSPRVDSRTDIGRKPTGEYYVQCGDEASILKKLSDGDARKVLDKAVFHRPMWKRQAHVLARDDAGTYYFVDRLRDDEGGKGYRIFAGPAGALKELPMTNVISDSVGEIYATKKGELRLITSSAETSWHKSGKKNVLTRVPVEDNVKMIYGDLGVYPGSLGTPCDDM